MFKFRNLRADEIDIRISQINDYNITFLLYKDARCDMNILDETVGPNNWKREHTRDNKNCIVSIWDDEKKQWITKEDTGVESNTQQEKGLASDSFKRSCINWGIGRELYSSPKIKIETSKFNMTKDKKGNPITYDEIVVERISYDENSNINGLSVANKTTKKRIFIWQPDEEEKSDK